MKMNMNGSSSWKEWPEGTEFVLEHKGSGQKFFTTLSNKGSVGGANNQTFVSKDSPLGKALSQWLFKPQKVFSVENPRGGSVVWELVAIRFPNGQETHVTEEVVGVVKRLSKLLGPLVVLGNPNRWGYFLSLAEKWEKSGLPDYELCAPPEKVEKFLEELLPGLKHLDTEDQRLILENPELLRDWIEYPRAASKALQWILSFRSKPLNDVEYIDRKSHIGRLIPVEILKEYLVGIGLIAAASSALRDAGKSEEAFELVKKYYEGGQPKEADALAKALTSGGGAALDLWRKYSDPEYILVAQEWAQKARELKPDSGHVYCLLMAIYAARGERENAELAKKKAEELGQSCDRESRESGEKKTGEGWDTE